MYVTKTDGTMWTWGSARYGLLANNDWQGPHGDGGTRSSPLQMPGTNWAPIYKDTAKKNGDWSAYVKTDGTLWSMGKNDKGQLGQNNQGRAT